PGGMIMAEKEKIRVLIVDDHSMFREGLVSIITRTPNMEVIGEAESGEEAIKKAKNLLPDVILMDIQMPGIGGIEACRKIKGIIPGVKIIMLTVADDVPSVFDSVKAGASGYVVKHASFEDLETAVWAAIKEEDGISTVATGVPVRNLDEKTPADDKKRKLSDRLCPLTKREKEILTLVSEGRENKEIAYILNISENTVKNHISNMFQKLQVNDRTEAVVKCLKEGWI
ncbi:MAG: response regulator transcription factor, partial [Candidatus Eremiobacteraeota bacterium]|nr:response regulator transcription factor [Candidatus Eremiobacteraeota bacterium]